MTLAYLAVLQFATGAAWAAVGLLNVIVLLVTGGEPVFGWPVAIAAGVVMGIVVCAANVVAVRRALGHALPAAGVPIAPPGVAVGRCIGPVALAVVVLAVLALIPGAVGYRGLAAVLFLCIGSGYVLLPGWVRRFEEQQGVLVAQLVNRWGLRGELRVLRLPR